MPSRNLNSLWGYGFFKKGFKSNGFQVVVWSQNLSFFLFRISSQIWRFSPKLRYLRFFLFRISSQIWRFSQKLRFSFLKGFQAKKGLVLHVLCPSHPCASLARTVLKPLSFAQAIHALVLHVLSLSLPTLSTSYPAGCEVNMMSRICSFLKKKFQLN